MISRLPLIDQKNSLRDCLEVIGEGAAGIALAVNEQGCLVGVVTDGDIRRGLLRGLDLHQSLDAVLHPTFCYVSRGPTQRIRAVSLMRENRIAAIPVVDEDMRPVAVEVLNDLMAAPAKRDELVVLMAGGRGMRLRPLTEDVPKPMLAVRGKPMLQHIIEQLIDQGFHRFVITLNYLGHVLKEFFQDGSAWGIDISYTNETRPLGTAGAIRLIEPVPEGTFVVMNGDVMSPFDLREMLHHHYQHESKATMAVSLQRTDLAYGVVRTKEGVITQIEEKPSMHHLVNAGLYVLDSSVLKLIPADQSFNMTDLFRRLVENGEVTRAFALYEDWVDVGQPEQYHAVNGDDR